MAKNIVQKAAYSALAAMMGYLPGCATYQPKEPLAEVQSIEQSVRGYILEEPSITLYDADSTNTSLFGLCTASSPKARFTMRVETLDGKVMDFKAFGNRDRIMDSYGKLKTGQEIGVQYNDVQHLDKTFMLTGVTE